MRTLVLLRGSAGCGKSTFVKNNGLEDYTLSSDSLRLLYGSPILMKDGTVQISGDNEKKVWGTLTEILKHRMEDGLFTVIDATNSSLKEVNKYKKLADFYRYNVIVVDFTDLPREECKIRNRTRLPEYKRVPNYVIDKFYDRFESQERLTGVKVIKPQDFKETVSIKPLEVSNYKDIQIIGDIHGCYDALMDMLDGGELKEDRLYVFTGDYCDRGIQNAQTMDYLYSIVNNDNVIFLEGNHERALWRYANDLSSERRQFEKYTKIELEEGGISKAKIRHFYRNVRQMALLKFDGVILFICHGGITQLPKDLHLIPTRQLIHGVGKYEEVEEIDKVFEDNTPMNVYQIHGHRNINSKPTCITPRCFCLEDRVEFGGYLRSVIFDRSGVVKTLSVKNNVFEGEYVEDKEVEIDFLCKLRSSELIREKKFGNISSFNFTRKAFTSKQWNNETIKARGLYVNTDTREVVVRSYDKFFNVNERPETEFRTLAKTFSYPVTAYVKYNGYLGLVGYDKQSDEMLVTTKSQLGGDYANWMEDVINTWDSDKVELMKQYVKDNNCTLTFEVIVPEHDTHMIKYDKEELVLLSIVRNNIEFEQLPYDEVVELAQHLNLNCKEKAIVLHDKQEFLSWYNEVTQECYQYNNEFVEGFVLEDSKGFMTKIKCDYYNFWKNMRGLVGRYKKQGDDIDTSNFGEKAKRFLEFLKTLPKEQLDYDIITLRGMCLEYIEKIIKENY